MNAYIPAILIFLGVVGLIVGAVLLFKKSKDKKVIPLTSLGDEHVCVTQIKTQIKSLPTDNHKKFCAALKKGFSSKCSNLQIIMTDEAGNQSVHFTYKIDGYYPEGNLLCNYQGKDMIAFRVREKGKPFTDEEWVTLSG